MSIATAPRTPAESLPADLVEGHGMTRAQRIGNLLAVIIPFVAVVLAIVLTWNSLVGWHDLALMAVMYVVTGLGITIGFHRLLTHRAFSTSKPMEYAFAVLGSMAVEGSVDHWVADHRKHHAHTDVEGDPHSPHVGHGDGVRGALRGLAHAHMGWMLTEQGGAQRTKYAKDLIEDPGMRWISKNFHVLATLSLAIPFVAGWIITGRLTGALTGFLWGGLVRVFLLHHVTWSINSVCHFFGRRRFATDDHSTNVAWLSVLSFGESWHHNHHAFPRSAVHGLRRREVDPSAAVIWVLEKLGLIWNVTRIPRERQDARLATGS
jgi:stearoyl-CoA desaturase (Delta-9 desaturase)